MKLLNPTQNNTAQKQQQVKNILRTQEIEKAVAKARVNLANAEADFNAVLAKNRSQWALEEEEHAKRVKAMVEEVNALEARRKNALIPVKFLQDEAEARIKEANTYYEQLKLKEARLDDLTDKLEDKLDAAGKQLTDNQNKASQLSIKEEATMQQAASIVAQAKQLSQKIKEFAQEQKKVYADLDKRKTELILIERSLVAKDEQLHAREAKIIADNIRIADNRKALEVAWEELRQKQRQISP